MTDFNQKLVALAMATLRADGKVDLSELGTVKRIAADLEFPVSETEKLIQEEQEKQSQCSNIKDYIASVSNQVGNPEEKQLIMEACIQVALADKKLDTKEVSLLLEICRALDCNLAKMICTIAIFAQNDRDIKIEGNDADFTEELVEE